MRAVKAICLTVLFGVVSIAIVILGTVVGLFLTVAVPVLMVFTGLWGGYAVWKEHAESKSEDED
jgi:ABC-type nickel/cobalt efflux system permease component RcnA